MAVRIVRLGTSRADREGVRIGTVRHPPRGVRKTELASRDFYDVWYPELAPSLELLSWARSRPQPMSDRDWARFVRKFTAEMSQPHARRTIELLAALSRESNFAVGCYCADESRCHRSVLRELFRAGGALLSVP